MFPGLRRFSRPSTPASALGPAGILLAVAALLPPPPLAPGQEENPAIPVSTHSAAEHFYTRAPAPDWVERRAPDLAVPLPFGGQVRPGAYFRLADLQTNADSQEEYRHFALEFLSPAGVHENSEFDIEFDPAYQELVIHRILRHRDGDIADIFDPNTVRITIPEDERVDGLLDGHVSVLVLLKDIRPGDSVEYEYTLKGSNPVFDGIFFDTVAMQWETTVQEASYRLLRRKDRPPLHHANVGFESEPRKRDLPADGREEWIWSRESIEPRLFENQTPAWFRRYASLELSEFQDWGEVAQWGARHYDFSDQALDPDLAAAIERIRKAHPTPEERTMAAIRFVQDEIRYLGIEDGANAFRPIQPNQCFRQRFGDCKDKTVLLGLILEELGIRSDPVCVAHGWKHTVSEMLPSPIAFDHVVLRIQLPDGRIGWCDATDSYQGGDFDHLAFPDYGKGLVLDDSTTGLAELPKVDPERNRTEVRETFHIGDIGEETRIEVETTYLGAEADNLRYHLSSTEPAALRQTYVDYYRENYLAIELVGDIAVEDDRDANRLVIRERYRLPNPWVPDPDDPEWSTFTLYLQTVRDLILQPDHTRRTMPFAIGPPESCRHELHLHLPGTDEDWAGYFEDDRYVIESEANSFERWMSYDPEKVEATIVATYASKKDAVNPEELVAFSEANGNIYELTSLDLWETDAEEDGSTALGMSLTEDSDGLAEDDTALAIVVLVSILIVGLLGLGFGSLLTFLVMRARTPAIPESGLPGIRPGAPGIPGRAIPPPLPTQENP